MRIATWNVNSLKARQEAVEKWLDAGGARHPADAGDQARRSRTRRSWRSRWPATSSSTTARGAGTASPSRRVRAGRVGCRHELRRRAGPRLRAGRRRRRRPSEDDFDPFDEARMVAATVDGLRIVEPLRAERPRRRLAVLRRASSPGSSGSPVGSPPSWRPARRHRRRAGPRRRPQRRPDRPRRLGRRRPPTAGPTSPNRSGPPSGRCSSPA